MVFVGLDAHQGLFVATILDPANTHVKQFKVKGTLDKFIVTLRKHLHGRPCRICFEASCDYGHLYDRLKKVAQQVVVAHPGKLRLIYADKRKNDKIDAFKLAKLLYAELVPQVHVPDEVVRSWRRTIELRTTLVHKRTRAKVSQRALLRGCGISMPKKLWSKKGLAWLSTVTLPTEADALHRDMLLDELDHFERQIKRATRYLDRVGSQHPGVWLLRTIPGVGPRTSEAVMAYIDRPHRFRRNNQIGAYFGLVPCQDQSAGRNRLGHITREGPATVRALLVEAAWWGVRHDPTLKAYFEKRCGKNGERKKIAIVATAHYLARVMLAMLKSGEVWRPAA